MYNIDFISLFRSHSNTWFLIGIYHWRHSGNEDEVNEEGHGRFCGHHPASHPTRSGRVLVPGM